MWLWRGFCVHIQAGLCNTKVAVGSLEIVQSAREEAGGGGGGNVAVAVRARRREEEEEAIVYISRGAFGNCGEEW